MSTRMRSALFTAVLFPLAAVAIAGDTMGAVREVAASRHGVIELYTKLRFTTMVLLPADEEILDVVCGDKEFWVISASQNMAHVKPAKLGASTNLNLVTASGGVYSFLLTEGKNVTPDLKVYVTADPDAARPKPKFYPEAHVTAMQAELSETRAAVDAAKRQMEETVASLKQQFPGSLQFAYGTPRYVKPFFVRAIWHDGQFTYIKSDAQELPALYEVKDGQPAVVNFQVQKGTYVVPKVLDQGYLALGKERFAFGQGR